MTQKLGDGSGGGKMRAAPRETGSIARQPCGRIQVRKVRKDGWTGKRRQLFLDRLAATCSVGPALAATGMAASSLYRLRRRDADFAEAWEDALTAHFDEVELGVVRHFKACLAGHGADNPAAMAEARQRMLANPGLALDLLKLRRAGDARVAAGAPRQRPGGRQTAADPVALADELMRMIRATAKPSEGAQ